MEEEADEPDGWQEDAVIETNDDEKPATDNENGNGINLKDLCNITYWMDTGNSKITNPVKWYSLHLYFKQLQCVEYLVNII